MVGTDSGIYIIFDNENPIRCYIGSTISFKRRKREHFSKLKNNKHYNIKLQNFVNKYGIDRLSFCAYLDCEQEEMSEIEDLEIKSMMSYSKKGFNMTKGVYRHTEETRNIISKKAKIRQSTKEVKDILSIKNSGVNNPVSKLSKEDIKYIKENFIRISPHKSNINEMAIKFNVNRKTINRIILNQTYKNE